jgi:serine-type D-Ala-D-Ala carboxypeptidase (penicillin-binding protein 5/6)
MRNATKVLIIGLVLLLACSLCPQRTLAEQQATSAYLVMDSTTGYVLDSSNLNRKLQVASLTKIATTMVVLDWLEVEKRGADELVEIPAQALSFPTANPCGLQPGDQLSIRDLLYAALLQSDNIAAAALADHVGRTLPGEIAPVDRFVAQMNALARRLGMTRTLFLNPHGLDSLESKLPYSTAADMGRLTKYAMSKPAFRFYVAQKERRISIQNAAGGATGYMLENTNELLGVENIDGVKTGRTARAGDCVIISAERPPETRQEGDTHYVTVRRLIIVVLGAPQRFPMARQLLGIGWQRYDQWAAEGRATKRGTVL